ncbi:hypothetical protein PFAG_00178 [Plasmodium falciparum Santa Lucia]|uniref:Microtubule-associated protein Jupiter n=8 Tax=Plasmodium falciparum TaxID=5833 RepID=Q8I668_PLAF7|nr:conserved Plasmodium protein, unknown function [Plasmodium falciparum 3D7]ETW45278.1 hypothetical protein PFNF135_00200 [Plasmodium falciparum NF135/5.C10]ETW51753.1 hypothetical protein PFMALIP_00178 [Plasmodium falciparum MaliPS096_E11]ETW57719.1 hypothetical protein PFUGPA_00169 [Plasmodium falciparum Palo Alto/Uganda]ETW63936.1 hypothetical protein PFMC_00171 [Plasmodium falciparum CAMP/Malaysia]EUR79212.1 hypothetical protein PFBG_00701 [Plasmodium falciparum 7G8]EUT93050.1 hypothetic|eukprot:XP_001349546.2 conserved Plasmodium protein, unknown function [Plasmodium falciparum 3D7]
MDVNDNPFIKNRSSTRITNAPGGNSSVSFGNYVDTESKKVSNKNEKSQTTIKENTKAAGNLDVNNENKKSDRRTNVKVNQPPGGASSIIFG